MRMIIKKTHQAPGVEKIRHVADGMLLVISRHAINVIMNNKFSHVYGPVPSRRLGRSLGVDLIPYKICSYDCVYCQLGRTTTKIIARKAYVPIKDVLRDVETKLSTGVPIDYITLSGSGEPTLYSKLQTIILKIKDKTDIPVAVITNGSLLWEKKVQNALLDVDLVVPSLDAGDEGIFEYVNRPHPDILFEKMTEGLIAFRERFTKKIWLEVFLLGGVTGIKHEVEKIALIVKKIKPDLVQLNTVARPTAEEYAYQVPLKDMKKFAKIFSNKTEVITKYSVSSSDNFTASKEDILALIKRRSCSLGDVAQGLSISYNEALKNLDNLVEEGKVNTKVERNIIFYRSK